MTMGLRAVLSIFSATSVTSELYGQTRFTLFAIILRRGMKACTSEKLAIVLIRGLGIAQTGKIMSMS